MKAILLIGAAIINWASPSGRPSGASLVPSLGCSMAGKGKPAHSPKLNGLYSPDTAQSPSCQPMYPIFSCRPIMPWVGRGPLPTLALRSCRDCYILLCIRCIDMILYSCSLWISTTWIVDVLSNHYWLIIFFIWLPLHCKVILFIYYCYFMFLNLCYCCKKFYHVLLSLRIFQNLILSLRISQNFHFYWVWGSPKTFY